MKTTEPTLLAGAVLLNGTGQRIGLLHRNTEEAKWWELPGGKVEAGERPDEAAVRELVEELGVRITIVRRLGSASFALSGVDYHHDWFLADVVRGRASAKESRFDAFEYFSVDEMADIQLSSGAEKLRQAIRDGVINLADK